MTNAPRLRTSGFILAIVVAALFVLSAPYIGQVRSAIRSAFPGHFVTIVGGAVGLMVVGALGAALLRIREHPAARYVALAASLGLAVGYSSWHATGRAEVDVVELFHFVEYGVITLLFYRAWRPLDDGSVFVLPILAGLLVGTLDEWLQWFIPVRVGELNDVLLNLVAIASGLLFSLGLDGPVSGPTTLAAGSPARIGRLLAFVVVVFALFFHAVHLGYRIDDPHGVTFMSRYPSETLRRFNHEKREQWRQSPLPMTIRRVSREDQYMSEGVVHVQERNHQWAAGNARAAWNENHILEQYFAPVLDTPSYVSASGHRWPDAQRADAAARVAAASAPVSPYVSDAFPYRLYLWPKGVFWVFALAFAAAVVTMSSLLDRPARA